MQQNDKMSDGPRAIGLFLRGYVGHFRYKQTDFIKLLPNSSLAKTRGCEVAV